MVPVGARQGRKSLPQPESPSGRQQRFLAESENTKCLDAGGAHGAAVLRRRAAAYLSQANLPGK